MKKQIFMIAGSMALLNACAVVSGNYEVQALNPDDGSVVNGVRILAQGRGIYTAKNALCQSFPGARLKVVDVSTGQELKNEGRTCRGNVADSAHTDVPKQLEFQKKAFNLAYQASNHTLSTFEYTTGAESVKNWQRLLTISVSKMPHISPTTWYDLKMKTLKNTQHNRDAKREMVGEVGYFSVVYTPSNLKSDNKLFADYEVNVEKAFFSCQKLVTISAAQRFNANTPNLNARLVDARQALTLALKNHPWRPICAQ